MSALSEDAKLARAAILAGVCTHTAREAFAREYRAWQRERAKGSKKAAAQSRRAVTSARVDFCRRSMKAQTI